jgi:hypothetical protein
MVKRTNDCLESIAAKLVRERNIPYFPGLHYGKTGIALFLCHCSSYAQNDFYSDAAYGLITEISRQLQGKIAVNYAYGISGIGAGIEYLVRNGYMEADTDEILADFDIFMSGHLTGYRDLSSFSQTVDIGRYFYFRQRGGSRKEKIRENIERTVCLMEMHLTGMPFCHPKVLHLLRAFRNTSDKAAVLFERQTRIFNMQAVKERPFEWFRYFYMTGDSIHGCGTADVNRLIEENTLISNDMENILWHMLSEREIPDSRLTAFMEQHKTCRNPGLINGLAGMGLTLLTLLDRQQGTWIEIL